MHNTQHTTQTHASPQSLDVVVALLDVAAGVSRVHASRRVFQALAAADSDVPVIHHARFPDNISRDALVLTAGTEIGALLVDGLGDGALLECDTEVPCVTTLH